MGEEGCPSWWGSEFFGLGIGDRECRRAAMTSYALSTSFC